MGKRREMFEQMRLVRMWLPIQEKWAPPAGVAGRGVKEVTRTKRQSYDPRYHARRRHSKRARRRLQR